MEPLASSLARAIFPGAGAENQSRGAGTEYRIAGQGRVEHQMAFHLDGAAPARESAAEFAVEPSVDAFVHGAEIIERGIPVLHVDRFSSCDLPGQFGFYVGRPRKFGSIGGT